VLSDLTAYREWNPFILEAVGTAEVGERLTLRMRPVGGRVSTLRPAVVDARQGELLRWHGRAALPGLLDADHSFVLEAGNGSGTRLVQREHFRGLLVPFLSGALDRGTLPAFALMNEALKRRAEQPVGSPRG
jgi:hypothetical protein